MVVAAFIERWMLLPRACICESLGARPPHRFIVSLRHRVIVREAAAALNGEGMRSGEESLFLTPKGTELRRNPIIIIYYQ
jgi:hypothetical protein